MIFVMYSNEMSHELKMVGDVYTTLEIYFFQKSDHNFTKEITVIRIDNTITVYIY